MHECPMCGQECDCDGEDSWIDYPNNCIHECKYDEYYDEYQPSIWEHIALFFEELPKIIDWCPGCKKPKHIFNHPIGDHKGCIPF